MKRNLAASARVCQVYRTRSFRKESRTRHLHGLHPRKRPYRGEGCVSRALAEPEDLFLRAIVDVDLGVRAVPNVLVDDGEERFEVILAVLRPNRDAEVGHIHQKLEGLKGVHFSPTTGRRYCKEKDSAMGACVRLLSGAFSDLGSSFETNAKLHPFLSRDSCDSG